MKNIFHKQKFLLGFTFVEVMITVAIIVILTAATFALTNKSNGQAKLTNACNEVASLYNKTRNYALAGKTVNGSVPTYFRLKNSADNKSIIIYYNDTGQGSGDQGLESKTFDEGIYCGPSGASYVGSPVAYNSKYFTVPNGDATDAIPYGYYTPGNIDCVYCSSYEAAGTCSPTGLIRKTITVTDFKAECK